MHPSVSVCVLYNLFRIEVENESLRFSIVDEVGISELSLL
jgi:hypothetical protein